METSGYTSDPTYSAAAHWNWAKAGPSLRGAADLGRDGSTADLSSAEETLSKEGEQSTTRLRERSELGSGTAASGGEGERTEEDIVP